MLGLCLQAHAGVPAPVGASPRPPTPAAPLPWVVVPQAPPCALRPPSPDRPRGTRASLRTRLPAQAMGARARAHSAAPRPAGAGQPGSCHPPPTSAKSLNCFNYMHLAICRQRHRKGRLTHRISASPTALRLDLIRIRPARASKARARGRAVVCRLRPILCTYGASFCALNDVAPPPKQLAPPPALAPATTTIRATTTTFGATPSADWRHGASLAPFVAISAIVVSGNRHKRGNS